MFGKRRKSKSGYAAESRHVGVVSDLVTRIRSTMDRSEIEKIGQELNRVISQAVSDGTPRRDLITIEQLLTQSMYISDWGDQQSGGKDTLLQLRISILKDAFEYLDSSF